MFLKDKINSAIDKISQQILKYNEHRKLFQNLFRSVKNSLNPSEFPVSFGFKTTDKSFAVNCAETNIEGLKIAGVDGGIIHRSLNFFDIALIRAVGVLFYYVPNSNPIVRYFPEENPFPDIVTSIEPLNQNEIESLISIWRMQKEIKCAISLVKEDLPDIIILDGSVLPYIDYKMINQSEFLVHQYLSLKTLFQVLDQNERTFEFYLSNFNEKFDKNLPDFDIHCFYLKTAEYDTPLRIEFPILFSNPPRFVSINFSISNFSIQI